MIFAIDKGNEDENLPSMDALDINEKNTIQSIPTYFGGEEDDDIPDMEEFDEADNVVENDPVSVFFSYSLTIPFFFAVALSFLLLLFEKCF